MESDLTVAVREQRASFIGLNTSSLDLRRVGTQGAIYLLFILTVVAFSIWAPSFATMASVANIIRDAAPTVVVAVGMTFVIIAAEIDLSVASTISLAGLVGAVLLGEPGVPWPVAVIVAIAIGAGVGLINGFLVGYLGVPSFLVTLGTLEAVGAIALMATGTLSVPITSTGFLDVFGPGSYFGVPITTWWAIVVVLVGGYILHGTKFGRWVYAVGDSRSAAKYAGISKARVIITVFVIAGVLAALTGLLLAGRTTSGDPTSGTDMELTAIAAVILGGTDLFGGSGLIIGTVVGAVFVTVIQIGLILLGASGQLQSLVTGAIIVGVVTLNALANGARKE